MTFQHSMKVLLISAAAVCCVGPANAQEVLLEATGTVDSFHGGFGNNSFLGQSITLDFSYDSSVVNTTLTSTDFILSSPITSAGVVGGFLGSGINLESNSGSIRDDFKNDGSVISTASTGVKAPSKNFTGEVFGFSLVQDAVGATIDLIKDVYNNGKLDIRDSGTLSLSNVGVGQVVAAPEIDPTSALSALTLLAGGLAVVRGRKFAKIRSA